MYLYFFFFTLRFFLFFFFSFQFFGGREGLNKSLGPTSKLLQEQKQPAEVLCKRKSDYLSKELSEMSCRAIFSTFSISPFHFLHLFLCGISFLWPVNWNWNLYVRRFGLILEITVKYIKQSKICFWSQFLSVFWHQTTLRKETSHRNHIAHNMAFAVVLKQR